MSLISLMACPCVFQDQPEFLSQQLGLAYIGAYIEKHGHHVVKYVDPMLDGGFEIIDPIDHVSQRVNRIGHKDSTMIQNSLRVEISYVFINAPFTDSRLVLYPLLKRIKRSCNHIKIVVGGVLSTYCAREVVENGADYAVKGEGEVSILKILNQEDPSTIPGIVCKIDGEIFEHPESWEALDNLDDLPCITDVRWRRLSDYISWSPRGNKFDKTMSMITSRSCPFDCDFCSVPDNNQKWRPLSVANIIEEINVAVNKFDVNCIEIEDDNFTFSEDHALSILNYVISLRRKGVDLSLFFPNGVMIHNLTKRVVEAMKNAGTKTVYLPVESGDKNVLMAMNKPYVNSHLNKTLEVISWCKEYDIDTSAFIIVGYPGSKIVSRSYRQYIRDNCDSIILEDDKFMLVKGEDGNSFNRTIDFCRRMSKEGLGSLSPLIATPYIGTRLYDTCKEMEWLRYGDKFVSTISYADLREEFININSPWCGYRDIYDRWKTLHALFQTKYNIVKV